MKGKESNSKKNWVGGVVGRGEKYCFFFNEKSKSLKIGAGVGGGGGAGGGGGFVNLFDKSTKIPNLIKFLFLRGGGGEREGVNERT